MAYGICRCAKLSGASSGSGAYIHNERKKDHSNSNPDIDFLASELNYSHGSYNSQLNYNERADERIAEGYTGKRAVRKDAVKMVEFLFASSDAESLNNHAAYLRECYKWLCDRFGADNVIADTVHLDEKTPHLHAVIVPLTKDGRLSCKEVIGGPKQLQAMQDDFYEKVSKHFGLERGEKADLQNPKREKKKHVPQMQFKKQTLAKLDEEITDKEKELKSAEVMSQFNQKKNESLYKTQEELLQFQKSLAKQIEEKNKALSEAQRELKRVQGRIYTETEREIDLRADNEVLKGENDRLLKEVSSLTDKFEALEKDYNNLDGVMEDKQEELKTLESSIKTKENAFQSITQKITNYFTRVFSVVEEHINKAREVAPTSSERANDSLDRAEFVGRGSIEQAKKQGLPKEIAEEAKEAVSEKVEKAAEEIAKQVPTFKRKGR